MHSSRMRTDYCSGHGGEVLAGGGGCPRGLPGRFSLGVCLGGGLPRGQPRGMLTGGSAKGVCLGDLHGGLPWGTCLGGSAWVVSAKGKRSTVGCLPGGRVCLGVCPYSIL